MSDDLTSWVPQTVRSRAPLNHLFTFFGLSPAEERAAAVTSVSERAQLLWFKIMNLSRQRRRRHERRVPIQPKVPPGEEKHITEQAGWPLMEGVSWRLCRYEMPLIKGRPTPIRPDTQSASANHRLTGLIFTPLRLINFWFILSLYRPGGTRLTYPNFTVGADSLFPPRLPLRCCKTYWTTDGRIWQRRQASHTTCLSALCHLRRSSPQKVTVLRLLAECCYNIYEAG